LVPAPLKPLGAPPFPNGRLQCIYACVIDERLIIAAAYRVVPVPEMIEDFVVQPDCNLGFAGVKWCNRITFALLKLYSRFIDLAYRILSAHAW
jgi:hypothetical protein